VTKPADQTSPSGAGRGMTWLYLGMGVLLLVIGLLCYFRLLSPVPRFLFSEDLTVSVDTQPRSRRVAKQLPPAEAAALIGLMRSGTSYPLWCWPMAVGDVPSALLTFTAGSRKYEVHVFRDDYCVVRPGVDESLLRDRVRCPGIQALLLEMQRRMEEASAEAPSSP